MSKKEIGFWLLVVGIGIHTAGNAKKLSDQVGAKVSPSTNDMVYYGATAGLVAGLVILWKSIR